MYGDPQALYSCDEGSIFPLCSNTSPESSRDLSMEHHHSSGLLRFRSAPSSLLENFSSNGNCFALNSESYPSSTVIEPINGEGCKVPYSMGMDPPNLLWQNSSPTELFSHLSAQSGYAKFGARRYRAGNEVTEHDISPHGMHSSSLGMLSRISEFENSRYPVGYNPPLKFSAKFAGLKRELDTDDHSLFSDNQGGEPRNQPNYMLSRQLSLPKASAEIASMEKLFQYSDSIPFKVRAKRGFATHPRSIAERVRRTRISERMKKLQELVPNMDKQTNTAGMLDLAVDYIKDLQTQYKILSDVRANCKCSAG